VSRPPQPLPGGSSHVPVPGVPAPGVPAPGVPAAGVPAGLRRDSVTGVGYLVLATWGYFLYGFGALLPQLGDDQGISRTLTSMHSVALAGGGLVAGLSAVPLVRALRRRGVFLLGCGLAATGILVLTTGGAWTAATLPGALIAGTGGSLLINTAMPTLSDHHGTESAAALAEGNAVAAGTGLVAPLVVGAGIAAGLTWRPAVLLTLPLLAVVVVALWRQARVPALDAVLPPRSESRLPLPAAVWPAVLLVVLCVGVEFVTTAWSADLLKQRTGMSAGAAAAGVSAVIAGMTLGRVVVGRLALRQPPHRILAGAILLTLAGWAVTWTTTAPAVALAGLLLTGLGIAAQYPMGAELVFTAATSPLRDRAAGILSVGIAIAAGGGPFVLGALADATSTHTAFLVVPALMVAASGLLTIMHASVARSPNRA
jgi:predicted MFS family arabinose efflux permease